MRPIYIIVISTLIASLASCIETVDPKDIGGSEEKVVVNGFLSPDDTVVSIEVSRSKPVIGKHQNLSKYDYIINNATVLLENEAGDVATLNYNTQSYKYETAPANMPIVSGQSYYLTVQVGGKSYTASCQIPKAKVGNISFKRQGSGTSSSQLSFSFDDIEGEDSYYRIGGSMIDDFSNYPLYFDLQGFQTDAAGDGSRITATADYSFRQADSVEIRVANVEEILYRYQYSSYNYYGDDPFSEPVIYPSNIEGGLGIFAGYQLTLQKIKIQ